MLIPATGFVALSTLKGVSKMKTAAEPRRFSIVLYILICSVVLTLLDFTLGFELNHHTPKNLIHDFAFIMSGFYLGRAVYKIYK